MFERMLTVKYVNLRNSFVYFPPTFKDLKTGACIQIKYGDNQEGYYSASTATIRLGENSIGINSLFAKTLGIMENELVSISEIPQLPTINSVVIIPINKDDYEVLEMLAENVQSTLLDQIRVVYSGQNIVLWIGNNINVTVYIENVHPVSPGITDFLTEVVIKPANERFGTQDILKNVSAAKQKENAVFDMEKLKSLKSSFFHPDIKINNNLEKFRNFKHDLIFRLIPLDDLPFTEELMRDSKHFNVFTSKMNIPKKWMEKKLIFCSIKLLTNDNLSNKTLYAKLLFLEDYLDIDFNFTENLFVSSLLFQTLHCHNASRVIVKYIEKLPVVSEISIFTKKNYLTNVQEKLKIYLAENSEDSIVLNSDIPMDFGDNIKCSLKFTPVESEFCIVDDSLVRNCKYEVHEENIIFKESFEKISSSHQYLESISNYQSIIDDALYVFAREENTLENILISGKPGTGRSTLLKIIAGKLESYPNFVYTKSINCKAIKGKTTDSLLRVFSTAGSELILHQPSVLFLDDLHVLCEAVKGDEVAPNSIYSNRVSEMLHNFLKFMANSNRIGVCATTESTSKLNKHIYSSRGSHLFKNLYTISDLAKVDRTKLMTFLFKGCKLIDVYLEDLSVQTDGFVVQDIVDFHSKTLFEVFKEVCTDENEDNYVEINKDHCEKALKNTCVLALQNVQLHSPGTHDFSDIGGLHDVKKVLMESLMWPAQYPAIFTGAPLRPQQGLLLYGPPGTGKTLLAAAAARHCGLRLISVKGPELLSKYIGASEQAVRDVFQRAQTARPCILFFDEFDSLAPRRGHDNTGVTDRVVNQLLTQLDGVESLSGVCVLAATSRPDLLDPALLRPGRLDRQLLCPLPDKISRLEILAALSKNLDLSSDADFQEIAGLTEGYSGADLQSILYTAQLSTVDFLVDDSKVGENTGDGKVTQNHLKDALRKTRPSLPLQERLKYERIYANFQGGPTSEDFKTGTKATLA